MHCATLSDFIHLTVLVMKCNFSVKSKELETGLRKWVDCKWSHKNPDCPRLIDVSAYCQHTWELHGIEAGGVTMNWQ